MRAVLLALVFIIAASTVPVGAASADTITLLPVQECSWILLGRIDNPNAICPSLDTRQGSRAAAVFDLSGIDADDVVSLTLAVQMENGGCCGAIEAQALSTAVPRDPFIYSLQPLEGLSPCEFAPPGSCPIIDLAGPFPFGGLRETREADVTDATEALLFDGPYLQLSFLNGSGQMGHSGFEEQFGAKAPRLIVETMAVVPEPGTALLVSLGLVGLARRRSGF